MFEISSQDADAVGGAGLASWLGGYVGEQALGFIGGAVMAGQIDYASIAESQGHYYNAMGA